MSAGQVASVNNINGPKQRLHSSLFNSDGMISEYATISLSRKLLRSRKRFG